MSGSIETSAVAALIVAAGRGLRAGGDRPKQYRLVEGQPVLARALTPFLADAAIDRIAVVIGEGDEQRYADAVEGLDATRLARPVTGGATRQASVRLGLRALARDGFRGIVLVHDAARPFVSPAQIGGAVQALAAGEVAAVPALPVTDTIKRTDDSGHIIETPPRDRLVSVQTPQAFRLAPLLAAHDAAEAAALDGFTDDAAIMEWAGHAVATFPGDPANTKLTHPEDFLRTARQPAMQLVTRVGTGYDVHAFALAERYTSAAGDLDDFLYIHVDSIVRGVPFLGGRIHHGITGLTQRFGHMIVDPNGRPAEIGGPGALNAYLSTGAILGRLAEFGVRARTLDDALLASRANEALVRTVLSEAGSYLGVAIANALNVLDIGTVVLGGALVPIFSYLDPAIRQMILRDVVDPLGRDAIVRPSLLGRKPVAEGAIALAMQSFLPLV